MKNILLALFLSTAVLIVNTAMATPIEGTSTSSFTSVQSPVTKVNDYSVQWGTDPYVSTLTTGTISPTGTTDGTFTISQDYQTSGGQNVMLASLTWANNDKLKNVPNGYTDAITWGLTIELQDPPISYAPGGNTLNLTLRQDQGADNIFLDDLSSLVVNIGDWQIDNFHYILSGPGSLDGSIWTTQKGQTSTLYLVADFKDPIPDNAPVPEPGTVVLLGAGLVAFGFYGRRCLKV